MRWTTLGASLVLAGGLLWNGLAMAATAALADLKAGKPVSTPLSEPYGCSVKYAE